MRTPDDETHHSIKNLAVELAPGEEAKLLSSVARSLNLSVMILTK